jgi:hypothetical protein
VLKVIKLKVVPVEAPLKDRVSVLLLAETILCNADASFISSLRFSAVSVAEEPVEKK